MRTVIYSVSWLRPHVSLHSLYPCVLPCYFTQASSLCMCNHAGRVVCVLQHVFMCVCVYKYNSECVSFLGGMMRGFVPDDIKGVQRSLKVMFLEICTCLYPILTFKTEVTWVSIYSPGGYELPDIVIRQLG